MPEAHCQGASALDPWSLWDTPDSSPTLSWGQITYANSGPNLFTTARVPTVSPLDTPEDSITKLKLKLFNIYC